MDLRLTYSQIRNDIKTCDVLLYQGNNWLSRAIRWAIKSPYSHAGIVVWWNDRLMVLEAVGKGVRAMPLSQNLKHYKGPVHLYTSKENISDNDRKKMLIFAQEELGKEYALWKMILFGIKILFKKDLDKRDEFRQENKLYCSQYVSQIYNSCGYDLKENMADRFMSPKDVADSQKITRVVGFDGTYFSF